MCFVFLNNSYGSLLGDTLLNFNTDPSDYKNIIILLENKVQYLICRVLVVPPRYVLLLHECLHFCLM